MNIERNKPNNILARATSSLGSSTARTKYCVNISNAFNDHTSEIASKSKMVKEKKEERTLTNDRYLNEWKSRYDLRLDMWDVVME
jgi:hypothetical protein